MDLLIKTLLSLSIFIPGAQHSLETAIRKTEIVAHRGASAYAPENTLAAFRLAAALGADWFELDCTLSRDNGIVVIHDDTVDRTTNGTGKVNDLSLEEIKRLDAGSWKDSRFAGERIPTLAEALQLARKLSIGVYVEIKPLDDDKELLQEIETISCNTKILDRNIRPQIDDILLRSDSRNIKLAQLVLDEIKRQRMQRRVFVQSFSPVICYLAKSREPKLRVELLGSPDSAIAWEKFVRWGYLFELDGLNPNHKSLSLTWLSILQASGKSVAVWTVDEEASMEQFARWGVNRIITNRPDVCREIVRRYR